MKLLSTSTDQHLVHPLVADAVVAHAVTVMRWGHAEVMTIPVVQDAAPSTVQILINPTTQLSARWAGGADRELSDLERDFVDALRARVSGSAVEDDGDLDTTTSFVDFGLYRDLPDDLGSPTITDLLGRRRRASGGRSRDGGHS